MRSLGYTVVIALLGCCLLLSASCGTEEQVAPPQAKRSAAHHQSVYGPAGALRVPASPRDEPRPNMIMVVIDTLRRDAIGLPGEPRGSMPYVESLAADAVSFRNAVAPASWTVPSFTSMLTGLMPSKLGCGATQKLPRLHTSVVTYAEALGKGHGYETAVYTSGSWRLDSNSSILQGFARGHSDAMSRPGQPHRSFSIDGAPEFVAEWDAARDPTRPFFLVMHTYDAHDPYGKDNHRSDEVFMSMAGPSADTLASVDVSGITTPADLTRAFMLDRSARWILQREREGFMDTVLAYLDWGLRDQPNPALVKELRDAYDGGTRWVDEGMSRLVADLRTRGLLENTLLVIASDHGEAFGEHGDLCHGRALYGEQVLVPLVMDGPGPFAAAKIVETPVALIDVLPTFMDWADLPDIPMSAGRSVLPAIQGNAVRAAVLSEISIGDGIRAAPGVRRFSVSASSAEWKYITVLDLNDGSFSEQLYDLRTDSGEHQDLAVGGRIIEDDLPEAFRAEVERARELVSVEADDVERHALGTGMSGPTADDRIPSGPQPPARKP